MSITSQFQSTLPVWGGTTGPGDCITATADFNPPSPCGEGLFRPAGRGLVQLISIHPPRVGRDWACLLPSGRPPYFNPPSPCGEGPNPNAYQEEDDAFQSTLPVWGGTIAPGGNVPNTRDFNPPSPCGEGRRCAVPACGPARISIHPPRVGRDYRRLRVHDDYYISIHPPRVGRDWKSKEK